MKTLTKRQKVQNWVDNFRMDYESGIMRELGYSPVLTSDRRCFDSLLSKIQKARGIKITRIGKKIVFGA